MDKLMRETLDDIVKLGQEEADITVARESARKEYDAAVVQKDKAERMYDTKILEIVQRRKVRTVHQ